MSDDIGELCPRCGCCELVPEECWQCGGSGYYGHDCGEDTCVCRNPEENVVCDICDGVGGWQVCLGGCNALGQHEEAKP